MSTTAARVARKINLMSGSPRGRRLADQVLSAAVYVAPKDYRLTMSQIEILRSAPTPRAFDYRLRVMMMRAVYNAHPIGKPVDGKLIEKAIEEAREQYEAAVGQ